MTTQWLEKVVWKTNWTKLQELKLILTEPGIEVLNQVLMRILEGRLRTPYGQQESHLPVIKMPLGTSSEEKGGVM